MTDVAAVGLPEPEASDSSIRDWVSRITTAGDEDVVEGGDTLVATICAAAVDPLEIAAALEAAGMSHQVVRDTYGHADVFAMAHLLWSRVPFGPGNDAPAVVERAGNWRDLARGALYAAPSFVLFVLTRALRLELVWWTLPVALTWGWALGQVMGFSGYTLRGRANAAGEAAIEGWLVLVATTSTFALAGAIALLFGGGLISAVAAAAVATYMVSSCVLLLHNEERIAALLLLPALVAAVFAFVLDRTALVDMYVVAVILASGMATLVAAARHCTLAGLRECALAASDLRLLLVHLMHGLLCGVALSLVAIQGARLFGRGVNPALIALPLILTLGVMEWQLRTFKSRVGHLMRKHRSLHGFNDEAWSTFMRSFGIYLVAGVVASAGVVVAALTSQDSPPYVVLQTQLVLSAAYFLDLTVVSVGRVDLVLQCWLSGAVVGAAYAASAGLSGEVAGDVLAWRAACLAAVVTFIALLVCARQVAPAATSH